ncbi:hypothetical protein HF086_010536 [Spodoptera exigua]|uniref:Uncharacterized protein n=1 Tax=Spodoptera exigua TaxID=7107 RepID=A0A922MVK7_SPOEX|nr:hypothetical protein HF086_010536 [Spodoptera exigua]
MKKHLKRTFFLFRQREQFQQARHIKSGQLRNRPDPTRGIALLPSLKTDHEGEMGQRVYVTDKDWLRINRHYNCPGAWD